MFVFIEDYEPTSAGLQEKNFFTFYMIQSTVDSILF